MCPVDADRIANCLVPDQTDLGLLWCLDLAVPVLRIFMVVANLLLNQ